MLRVVTLEHRTDLVVRERVDKKNLRRQGRYRAATRPRQSWVNWNLKPLEGSVAARLCSEKQNWSRESSASNSRADSREPSLKKFYAAVG